MLDYPDYNSIGVSFTDVLKIEKFSNLSQFDLLYPKHDSEVAPYLFHAGCDIDKAPFVQACRHRNFQGESVIGYRYLYPERRDREWVKSGRCSLSSRITFQEDMELRSDMIKMSRQGFKWPNFKPGTDDKLSKQDKASFANDLQTMTSLKEIQERVRGPLHPEEDMLNVGENLAFCS